MQLDITVKLQTFFCIDRKKYFLLLFVHVMNTVKMNVYCFDQEKQNPPKGLFSSWLYSGAAAGGWEAGQGLYCVEINHITRKQKTWLLFLNYWMTSLTVTHTAEAVALIYSKCSDCHLLHFLYTVNAHVHCYSNINNRCYFFRQTSNISLIHSMYI